MNQKTHVGWLLIFLLCSAALVAGCARRSSGGEPGAGVQIDVEVSPQPLKVGPAQVAVTLKDKDGQPIENAEVEVEGDMSHAGMVPVFADAGGGAGGRYTSRDFKFTMGGDWFIIVHARLPDGRLAERTFDLKGVAGGSNGN